MKILIDIIPAHLRKVVYAAFAFVGLVIGSWMLIEQPVWLVNTLQVYNFVGVALGLTAYSNTDGSDYTGELGD